MHLHSSILYNLYIGASGFLALFKVMGTQISVRHVDNVVILDLVGRFVDTLSICDSIKELLDKGALNILVNLEKAKLIGNGTTGELVSCWVKVKTKGGVFKVLNPDKDEKRWIEVCKLDKIFDIYYDEQLALSSFR